VPRFEEEIGLMRPGLTFPMVVIQPTAWYHDLGPGGRGLAKACVKPYVLSDEGAVMAVHLSAVVALEFHDEWMIEGLLAHEFLHYVWTTVEIHKRFGAGQTVIGDWYRDGYDNNWNDYKLGDKELQAPAESNLSKRLIELMTTFEDSTNRDVAAANQRIYDGWVKTRKLVIERLESRFQYSGTIFVDETLKEASCRATVARFGDQCVTCRVECGKRVKASECRVRDHPR
jgi:hypothetical protein